MATRRGTLRKLSYALVAFLAAGCLVSGVVTIAAEGRDSEFNPWVVGFGGSLAFVFCAGQTAQAGWLLWRSWLLRLFGRDTWALLVDKAARSDADQTTFWTAHVVIDDLRHSIDTGLSDPGPVGEPLRVRWHAASGQVELAHRAAAVNVLVRDLLMPVVVLVLAVFTAAIGYGLFRVAASLL